MKKSLIAVLAISILIPNITYASTEMYDFKDTKTEGFIQIIKEWSSNIKTGIPDISVSGDRPSKDRRGYTVTLTRRDGEFPVGVKTNDIIYSRSGRIVQGDYIIPS